MPGQLRAERREQVVAKFAGQFKPLSPAGSRYEACCLSESCTSYPAHHARLYDTVMVAPLAGTRLVLLLLRINWL